MQIVCGNVGAVFVCFGNGMWSDPCTILPQDRHAGHDGLHYSRATRMHVLVSVFLVKGGSPFDDVMQCLVWLCLKLWVMIATYNIETLWLLLSAYLFSLQCV